MKKTLKIFFLATILCLSTNCDNNDDAQTNPMTPTDGFTHDGIFHPTENAYFEIDEDDDNADGFPDEYNFFFSNGRMFDNQTYINNVTDDYLFSLNTTNWVFYNLTVDINPSLANSSPIVGATYVGSSNDGVIIEDGQIDFMTPPFFYNNIEFGRGNENVGIFNTPGVQGPTITINAINLDPSNPMTSTINVDYTFINQNGDVITGHYNGTFGVIYD